MSAKGDSENLTQQPDARLSKRDLTIAGLPDEPALRFKGGEQRGARVAAEMKPALTPVETDSGLSSAASCR